jgi:hypothetical protein
MRRLFVSLIAVLLLAAPAGAATVRDIIELSKAGVGDQVLLALIEIDPRIYTIDSDTVKALKAAGVSEPVIVAMIRSGRTPPAAEHVDADEAQPSPAPMMATPAPEPQVVVIDHHDEAPPQEVPVAVPVAVPVYVPIVTGRQEHISTIVTTDTGAAVRIKAPVPPNCTRAEPIYWGNGGKRRPGTWEPPPQIVCR